MEMEFDVKITKKDLYEYQLYHAYTTPSALIGTTIGCLFIIGFIHTGTAIMLIAGIFAIAYIPWMLNIRAASQAASDAFKHPIHYKADENGLEVSIGEEKQLVPWDVFTKATTSRKSVLLYTSKVNAYIFPRRVLGEDVNTFVQIISRYMPAKKVKIRGSI